MQVNNNRFLDVARKELIALPRPIKATIAFSVDAVCFAALTGIAVWVLTGNVVPERNAWLLVSATTAVALGVFWWQGLYRHVLRYVGADILEASVKVAAYIALASTLIAYLSGGSLPPLRWGVLVFACSLVYFAGSRYLASSFLLVCRDRKKREKVIIYGAGSSAAELALNLFSSDRFLPVALIDDDPALYRKRVKGLEIFPPSQIGWLITKFGARRVLLAMPRASRRQRRKILKSLSEYQVHVQTVPAFHDLVSGRARVDDLTDVDVKDLLGRDPVEPKEELLRSLITARSVMVTGAGGSIGSELCRQMLALEPKRLVLVELSEAALYQVSRELNHRKQELNSSCEIVSLLGSVHHEGKMREALKAFDVATVYHAAAYKHVPIVEQNFFEGIHNNIFGTLHTARAADAAGVDSFILISTDKAVNPVNVMGATKRFAELILQAFNAESKTRFSMVRFGNVLESSGSVVPLFKEQIRKGGPITVTHRDIIRYFMTIPEAAQLVLQAGSMADGGDVFVLDMGKPVRILDLAKRMVRLMGLTVRDSENPDGDIDIEFVGLRPAEKLYEELLIGTDVAGTEHPRILRADEDWLPMETLQQLLSELAEASQTLDFERARSILLSAIKEYRPDSGISDLVFSQTAATRDGIASDTVIDFPNRA